MSHGFNTEGQPRVALSGPVYLELEPEENRGIVFALVHESSAYDEVVLDRFEGEASHESDGIARETTLHGGTGRGSDAVPQVEAVVAAWGEAAFHLRSDPPPLGLAPDATPWDAEVFLVEDGVRGEGGRMQSAGGGAEIHLVLVRNAPANETFAEPLVEESLTAPPEGTMAVVSFDSPYAQGTGRFELAASDADDVAVSLTQVDAALIGPNGSQVAQIVIGGPSGEATAATEVSLEMPGPYVVRLNASGPDVDYEVRVAYSMPDVVLHFWWETVATGDEAESFLREAERLRSRIDEYRAVAPP